MTYELNVFFHIRCYKPTEGDSPLRLVITEREADLFDPEASKTVRSSKRKWGRVLKTEASPSASQRVITDSSYLPNELLEPGAPGLLGAWTEMDQPDFDIAGELPEVS